MIPSISVISPIYNMERLLSKCIDSILAQTFNDFELILIDDGSTDRSGVICDEYATRDSRIKVIHKKNEGVSIARQLGIDFAQGEYTIPMIGWSLKCWKSFTRKQRVNMQIWLSAIIM